MRVITLVGQGKMLTDACDEVFLNVSTFRKYVATTPELVDAFSDAEQRGYDALADSLLTIHKPGNVHACVDTKEMKIVSDNAKWLLEKRRNKQYGQKVLVETHVTADRAIIDALSRARDRATRVIEDVPYTVIDITPLPSSSPAVDDEDLSQFI